jgi:hypothetical protein
MQGCHRDTFVRNVDSFTRSAYTLRYRDQASYTFHRDTSTDSAVLRSLACEYSHAYVTKCSSRANETRSCTTGNRMVKLLVSLGIDTGSPIHATEIRSHARVRRFLTSQHVKAALIFTCFMVELESINPIEA